MGSVVVALDRTRIANLAGQYDAVIELVPAIGAHVPGGGTLLNVYGPCQLPERQLRRGVLLGDERTLDDDPAFAIRMLVDVAIKALSPAVNGPTTAVQSLDRIEDLLRYAAPKDLSVGTVTDSHGAVRFVYPTPTWDDLVELALDEIRAFGAGQYQVARAASGTARCLDRRFPGEQTSAPPRAGHSARRRGLTKNSPEPARRRPRP